MAITQQAKEEKLNIESVTCGDLTWVDIVNPTQKEMNYLAKNYSFHPLALEDCLSRRQLPKIDDYRDYLFLIFPFSVWDRATRVSHQEIVSAFLGEKYLVTIHSGQLKTLEGLFHQCQINDEALQPTRDYGSGYLLYRILDMMVDAYFPILNSIVGWIDDIEDIVFDERVEAAREIATLRRDVVTQRRVIHSLRTIIMELERKIRRFIKVDVGAQFGDIKDHLNKITETLDEAKEAVEIFKDADWVLSSERVNRIIRVLTVLSTIAIPFLVITSIYGMNIFLPGGTSIGSFKSFFILIGVMFSISGIMLYIFRHQHWL